MRRAVTSVLALAVFVGLVAIFSVGYGQTGSGRADNAPLEARAAFDLIQKNRSNGDFVILDVRTPDEFKEGHIEGAINVDYNSGGFKTELGELDKEKTYFVYCRTGRRSAEAVKIMKELGFGRIVRMKGDMVDWRSARLPLAK
jgi:rhodanese-related sulfurtransferase